MVGLETHDPLRIIDGFKTQRRKGVISWFEPRERLLPGTSAGTGFLAVEAGKQPWTVRETLQERCVLFVDGNACAATRVSSIVPA